MKWGKEDLAFLNNQRDFCVEFLLKGYDLGEAGVILTEIINNVSRKNTKKAAKRKVVVRWCKVRPIEPF